MRVTILVGTRFCQNCGSLLIIAQPIFPTPPSPLPPFSYPTWSTESTFRQIDYRREDLIDRTKTGLLLLILGTIIGAIPIIGILGGIIAIIGAIVVILGRDPFGQPHSKYVLWYVGLYIVGSVIVFVFTIGFALAVVDSARAGIGTTYVVDTLISDFNNFIVELFLGAAILSLAHVLFTYALQKPTGRALLWAGYVGSLALGIYVLSVIGSQVSSAVQAAFAGGTFNRAPIDDLQGRISYLRLFDVVPAIIYGIAYYLAWSRVNNGEVPEPLSRPSTPTSLNP